jgi:endoglucanase
MLRHGRRTVGLALLAACLGPAACATTENPRLAPPTAPDRPAAPKLVRGINLGNALDAPNEGQWGVVLQESDFSRIRDAGFDHVRLPVRFSAHASASQPYVIEDAFFRRVDWAIGQALANGLTIIVDLHHYEELTKDPEAHAERFVGLWTQIAQRYRASPESVWFELLNEPNGALTADRWNTLLARALRTVRVTNPSRTVVLEGVDWASAKNLRDTLAIPDDAHVVGSFHMYQPILFTHQGAPWMPPEFQTTGVHFPGPPAAPLTPSPAASAMPWVHDWFDRYNREPAPANPSGPTTIVEQFAMASDFASARHLPVYMGEFGAIENADMASRVEWIRQTRAEAERRGFGWAYWDDGGKFKAYDRSQHMWVPEILEALRR